jgi:aspartyl aminopeptidase
VQVRNVKINEAICRIPTLAIHLARGTGTKLEINTETHLPAVISSVVKAELGAKSSSENAQHHSVLIDLVAKELNCDPNHIDDFELQLCEVQPSIIGGAKKEFIFSGRLDNLCSVYCGLRALIDTTADVSNLQDEKSIRLLAVFDHEEIGSTSTSGARGTLMTDSINRIANAFVDTPNANEIIERATQKSFMISSDMAHGIHPNYSGKHAKSHGPKFHEGVVIKTNVNQRYATVSK